MVETINEKFGIELSYFLTDERRMEKVHFWANNQVEIQAFVMDDVEEYQDDIKGEIKFLKNAKTKKDIIDYLEYYVGWNTTENFKEEDFENGYNKKEDSYLLDFKEFKIVAK